MSWPKSRQRVSSFYHPSIHQLSTLEKTKLCHRPTLSGVLRVQKIVCGGALVRDLCHGRQRVAPFYHISQLSHSKDSDFHSFSSLGFLTPKMTGALAIRLIIGPDFAVTLSSPDSVCVLFDITSEQSVELKWLMLNKHKR